VVRGARGVGFEIDERGGRIVRRRVGEGLLLRERGREGLLESGRGEGRRLVFEPAGDGERGGWVVLGGERLRAVLVVVGMAVVFVVVIVFVGIVVSWLAGW
jgi:hypothetical protein